MKVIDSTSTNKKLHFWEEFWGPDILFPIRTRVIQECGCRLDFFPSGMQSNLNLLSRFLSCSVQMKESLVPVTLGRIEKIFSVNSGRIFSSRAWFHFLVSLERRSTPVSLDLAGGQGCEE